MQQHELSNSGTGRIGQSYDFDNLEDHYIDVANFYELEIMTIKMRYQNKHMPRDVKAYIDDLRDIVATLWTKSKE